MFYEINKVKVFFRNYTSYKEKPFCLNNLIRNADFAEVEREMKSVLLEELKKSEDPEIVGTYNEVFDSYI